MNLTQNRKLNIQFPFGDRCKEDFKIDLTVDAKDLYACRGAPLEYSITSSYAEWLYVDCRIDMKNDKIISFEHGVIGRLRE